MIKKTWITNPKFEVPTGDDAKLVSNEITNFDKKYLNDKDVFAKISKIIHLFSNDPWLYQEEILNILKIDIPTLLNFNKLIRDSEILQDLIINHGAAKKYWQSISPFCSKVKDSLENKFHYPMRIALYPGVS